MSAVTLLRRAAPAAALAAAALAGVLAADAGVSAPRPRMRTGRPVRAPLAAWTSRPAADGDAPDVGPSAAASPTSAAVAAEDDARREAPSPRGEGTSLDAFSSAADWTVLYERADGPTALPPSVVELIERDGQAAAEAERLPGAPPWAAATFQAAGLAEQEVAVLGRDFRARASPQDSARWYARRAGVDPADPRAAAALERLTRFEQERFDLVVRVIDRVVEIARGREDPDVVAYYVARDRIRLFRASADPDVAGLAAARGRLEEQLHRRAKEICE